jgi:hypothetical protein
MGAINRFRDRGYKLKVKEDEIIFENIVKTRYIFDLKKQKVRTNLIWSNDEKVLNRLVRDFKKELRLVRR